MRRLAASLALTFFVIVPVLQWHCLVACADDERSAPQACAHATAAAPTGRALQNSHDCDHPSSPALIATVVVRHVPLPLPASEPAFANPHTAFSTAVRFETRPPGTSPGRLDRPLRI